MNENDIFILFVNPAIERQITEDLKGCGDVEPISALKSSIDGNVPEVVITLIVARDLIMLIREVILEHTNNKNNNIKKVRIGEFEVENISPSSVQELFSLYIQSVEGDIGVEYINQGRAITKESKQTMAEKENPRIINVSGNYIESNSGTYVQGNYVNMSQDLTQAASQIQELLMQLQKQGSTKNAAQQQVGEDLANQSRANSTVMGKLVTWGQSLADTASKTSVSEATKIVITTALRLAGVPIP
jgi:hypothetical protein